jgi:hypothetical protein
LRVHHSFADGFSIFKLTQNLSITATCDKFEYIQPHDYTQTQQGQNNTTHRLVKTLTLFLKMGYDFTEFLFLHNIYTSNGFVWKLKESSEKKKNDNDLNKTRLLNHKTAHGKPFSIREINEIKEIYGVSGTSVLFSGIIGSVRTSLFKNKNKIPPIVAMSIILPLPKRKENAMGNRM